MTPNSITLAEKYGIPVSVGYAFKDNEEYLIMFLVLLNRLIEKEATKADMRDYLDAASITAPLMRDTLDKYINQCIEAGEILAKMNY